MLRVSSGRPAAFVVTSALLLLCLACSSSRGGARAPASADRMGRSGESSPPFEITVENHNWLDATILVYANGTRTRLGTVPGSGSLSIDVPARIFAVAGDVRFIAELVGARSVSGGSITSQPVSVRPGQSIVWTLETDLGRSMLTVE